MDQILEIAKKLGEAVKAHERCTALREASKTFQEDDDAQKLREEYDAAVAAVRAKMAQNQPLEPDEKRAEAELRAKVSTNLAIVALLKAQADFHELMNSVNETIQEAIDL